MKKPPIASLELALQILETLKTRELTREELAIMFDVSQATIWRSLAPMVRAGLVRERELNTGHDDGRWRLHYATKAWSGVTA